MSKTEINKIKAFWESHTCGTINLNKEQPELKKYSREYFKHIAEHRYAVEPWVHEYAQFTMRNKEKVLEVGCGAGTDAEQFCKAGAIYTGIDLTSAGVKHTKSRLKLLQLKGKVLEMSGDNLKFNDNTFDFVFSWGVIHHTPKTEQIINEIYRVLKPGGKFCILVYNTYSWVVIKTLLKWGLLHGELFTLGFDKMMSKHTESEDKKNPYTKTFTKNECKKMFKMFSKINVETRIARADRRNLPFFSKFSFGGKVGWQNIITGQK